MTTGITCPSCGATSRNVIESRRPTDRVRRRCNCIDCGGRFTTWELRHDQLSSSANQILYSVKPMTTFLSQPELSDWACYLFGNRPGGTGLMYRPNKGCVPNRFVRFMMLTCFDCLWVNGSAKSSLKP